MGNRRGSNWSKYPKRYEDDDMSTEALLAKLRYREMLLKAAMKKNDDLESAKLLKAVIGDYEVSLSKRDAEIKELKDKCAKVDKDNLALRASFEQLIEDAEKEHQLEIRKITMEFANELKVKENTVAETMVKLQEAKDDNNKKDEEIAELKRQIALKDVALRKAERIQNLNSKNSSVPSNANALPIGSKANSNADAPTSQHTNKKAADEKPKKDEAETAKDSSGEQETKRRKGAQEGHTHHDRKREEEPDYTVHIETPEELLNPDNFEYLGRKKVKQVKDVQVKTVIINYEVECFRDKKTGKIVHAHFPAGVVDDVNYGANIKSLIYLLTCFLNTPVKKTGSFISYLTEGKIKVSDGFIDSRKREFSKKCSYFNDELKETINISPYMHADFTPAKVNGSFMQVLVLCNELISMYFLKEHKGFKGVEGTPLEHFIGALISDDEYTFAKYGTEHQRCLAHIIRALTQCSEVEPDLTWHTKMKALLQEMIHYNNEHEGAVCSEEVVKDFRNRFKEICDLAESEYSEGLPDEGFPNGFNLKNRLTERIEEYTLFLEKDGIPPTNAAAETLVRPIKVKMRNNYTFKRATSLQEYLDGMTVIRTLMKSGHDVLRSIKEIFEESFDFNRFLAEIMEAQNAIKP